MAESEQEAIDVENDVQDNMDSNDNNRPGKASKFSQREAYFQSLLGGEDSEDEDGAALTDLPNGDEQLEGKCKAELLLYRQVSPL